MMTDYMLGELPIRRTRRKCAAVDVWKTRVCYEDSLHIEHEESTRITAGPKPGL